MQKILFICKGNVGRSQMAEGFWRYYTGKNNVISAGIEDVAAKYNHHPREDIIEVMKEKDIDISQQRIKQITPKILKDIDCIVVLCNPKLLPDFVKSYDIKVIYKRVPDPYKDTLDGTKQARDQIEGIILDLIP